MTGATITARLEDREIRAGLARLARMGTQPGPLLRAIGTGLAEVTRTRFDDAKDPDGNSWAALSPAYSAIKRGPGILREAGMRGGLQGSITFEVAAGAKEVAVGTNKVYAAVHQFGATIRPKSAGGRLVFRTANGLAFARSVTVPARPFLGFGAADRQAVLDVIEAYAARG
jgi:phage virion morphogenesis protein